MRFAAIVLTVLLLPGCRPASREETKAEAFRLRESIERHRATYTHAIETENALTRETREWLRTAVNSGDRVVLRHEASRLTAKWARAFFMLREMHAALKYDRYRSADVRWAQKQILDHLNARYNELHDFQRYSQYTTESAAGGAPAAQIAQRLAEFRLRIDARPEARDEITGMLASLRL